MQVNRKSLTANTETAFTFDSYDSNAVVVKNETAGEIFFCDGLFDASKAVRIPPFSWQALNVSVHFDSSPRFTVKAAVAGSVEIDFGSSGMGALDVFSMLNAAGLIPHTLTFAAGADTTFSAELIRTHGVSLDLDTPVALTTGATLYTGDVVKFTAASTDLDCTPALTINGAAIELTEGVATYTIQGETAAATEAIPIPYALTLTVGDGTTLTVVLVRERGSSEDLEEPLPLATDATVLADDIVRFTAIATEEGYHAVLTVNSVTQELTDNSADYTVAGDTTAVSETVADG